MNWEAIGAAGETLGTSTVLITLVYLAIQIRYVRGQVESSTLEHIASSLNDFAGRIVESEGLADIMVLANHSYSSLTEATIKATCSRSEPTPLVSHCFKQWYAEIRTVHMEPISNSEILELILVQRQNLNLQFQFWLTITFALVVAIFVAGKQLSRQLRVFASVLYLLATATLIARYQSEFMENMALIQEAKARPIQGESSPYAFWFRAITVFVGSIGALFLLFLAPLLPQTDLLSLKLKLFKEAATRSLCAIGATIPPGSTIRC